MNKRLLSPNEYGDLSFILLKITLKSILFKISFRQPTLPSPQSPQSSPRRGSDGNDSDHSAEYCRVLDPIPVARHRTRRVRNLRD